MTPGRSPRPLAQCALGVAPTSLPAFPLTPTCPPALAACPAVCRQASAAGGHPGLLHRLPGAGGPAAGPAEVRGAAEGLAVRVGRPGRRGLACATCRRPRPPRNQPAPQLLLTRLLVATTAPARPAQRLQSGATPNPHRAHTRSSVCRCSLPTPRSAANLGDSGFVVIGRRRAERAARDKGSSAGAAASSRGQLTVKYRSPQQEHSFGHPYQLGGCARWGLPRAAAVMGLGPAAALLACSRAQLRLRLCAWRHPGGAAVCHLLHPTRTHPAQATTRVRTCPRTRCLPRCRWRPETSWCLALTACEWRRFAECGDGVAAQGPHRQCAPGRHIGGATSERPGPRPARLPAASIAASRPPAALSPPLQLGQRERGGAAGGGGARRAGG